MRSRPRRRRVFEREEDCGASAKPVRHFSEACAAAAISTAVTVMKKMASITIVVAPSLVGRSSNFAPHV